MLLFRNQLRVQAIELGTHRTIINRGADAHARAANHRRVHMVLRYHLTADHLFERAHQILSFSRRQFDAARDFGAREPELLVEKRSIGLLDFGQKRGTSVVHQERCV